MDGIDEKSLFEIGTLYSRMRTIAQIIDDLDKYEVAIDDLNAHLAENKKSCNTFLHIRKGMFSSGDVIKDVIKNFELNIEFLGEQIKRLEYQKSVLVSQIPHYSGPVVPSYIFDKQSKGGKTDWATNWYLKEISKYFKNRQGEISGSDMNSFFEQHPELRPPELGYVVPKALTDRISRLNRIATTQLI